jgi:ubiquinone/menaquinone biosynthesis C-methylase UbiE
MSDYDSGYYGREFNERGNRFANRISKAKLGKLPFKRMLDVGCGVGNWSLPFKEKAVGVDISAEAVKICRSKGLDARKFDGERLPFKDASFDLIICHHVLEHAKRPKRLLSEMRRVLQKEGTLILTVPHKRVQPQDPTHLWFFDEEDLKKIMEGTGFKVKMKRPFWKFFRGIGRLPFPVSLALTRAYAAVSTPIEVEAEGKK